jgi:predicted metalloendopeptidase
MRLAAILSIILSLALPASSVAGESSTDARLNSEQIANEVLGAMDRTADPCANFYRYSCGTWIDNAEIPPDRPRWVRSFSVLRENNREVIRELIEQAAEDPGSDPDRQRVGAYYGACMDEAAVEEAGTTVLEPLFEAIAGIDDAEALFRVAGTLYRQGIGSLFGVGIFEDFKNPEVYITHLVQGGLGLPDRDYYLSEDPKKRELLADYEAHVARMFELIGEAKQKAATHAAQVVALETRLATASRERTEMRNYDKQINRADRYGLAKLNPGIPWVAFLRAAGHPDINDFNIRTPEFFDALEELVADTEIEQLKTYLRWHVVDATANRLPAAFVDANFEFYGAKLSGQKEIQVRWKRCVSATSGALGEAIGRLYVDAMFAGDSKGKALEMIHDIEKAFENNLETVAWMDDETRARAVTKLEAVRNKIGYPDRWRDYSKMKIGTESYFSNALAAAEHEFDYQANKAGKPVDKKEWIMTPQTVNAGYNPLGNEIIFPAGILQPPFFHRDFPAVMNYGGIGFAIGHELTHGYDDQGRKFDPSGKLEEWWEPDVSERYTAKAQCVDDYYSKYEVEPGVNVNGKLTLGENIADLGGIKLVHRAYKLWEKRHGTPEPFVDGLSNDQLLFVAGAQTWCAKISPEFLRMQVTTDPHSPAQFRVDGPFSNLPAFAEAFGCEVGSPMRPEQFCAVW